MSFSSLRVIINVGSLRTKSRRARNTCFGLINNSDIPEASSFKLIIETRCNRCLDHCSTINHDCRRSFIVQKREKEREREKKKRLYLQLGFFFIVFRFFFLFFEFFSYTYIYSYLYILEAEIVLTMTFTPPSYSSSLFSFSYSLSLSLTHSRFFSHHCAQ